MPYLFSYPTTTFFVDDNENFCSTIMLSLDKRHKCIASTNPIEALQFIEENQKIHKIYFNEHITSDPDDILEGQNIIEQKISTREFSNLAHLKKRHEKITTIVLDHEMPEMNGFLFSKNVCREDVSIIMLTGKATHELAVEAFNLGLIDKFLLKDSPNLILTLSQCIEDSKHNFFYKQTNKLSYNTRVYDILFSEGFSRIFSNILSQYNISEYYLINSHGCYLLITEKNEYKLFIFMSQLELNYYIDVAEGNQVKGIILDKLNTGYIPCFYENEMNVFVSHWEEYLYVAEKIVIKDKVYHYAVRDLVLVEEKA